MSKSPVSSQLLLEGGWYALEQCGRLLDDAAYLFDSARYGAAAGLALLAREELGKARLLFKFSSEVEGGARLTRALVQNRIENHLNIAEPIVVTSTASFAGPREESATPTVETAPTRRTDIAAAKTENWWGKVITVSLEQIFESR